MAEDEPHDMDCLISLKYELDAMRARRRNGPMEELSCTFQYIADYYTHILQVELFSHQNIMDFFGILVNSLTNPYRSGNAVTQSIVKPIRPCELWERFAEYYLRFIKILYLPPPSIINVTHTGRRNDRGIDVFCQWGIHTHNTAVVQVKRGIFFRKGKATDIVLKLIGSMVISGARIGIVFTNESYDFDVKADTRKIIEIAKLQDLNIYILDVNEMKKFASQDAQSCKNLMIEFIRKFLE